MKLLVTTAISAVVIGPIGMFVWWMIGDSFGWPAGIAAWLTVAFAFAVIIGRD